MPDPIPVADERGITWQHVAMSAIALLVAVSGAIGALWGIPAMQRLTETQQQLVTAVTLLSREVEGLASDSAKNEARLDRHHDALLRGGLDVSEAAR